jgi:hypothetical protein
VHGAACTEPEVAVETIQDFVNRTKGPLVPYVDAWYPWVYAHHYLRSEIEGLPDDVGVFGPRLTPDEAIELIQFWCGLTGESIEGSARALADAYLQRWGMVRKQAQAQITAGRHPRPAISSRPAAVAVPPVEDVRLTKRPGRQRPARGVTKNAQAAEAQPAGAQRMVG